MSTQRIIGIVLLLVGVVALIVGMNSSHTAAEQIAESLTGRFTHRTAWYVYGGGFVAAIGLLMMVAGRPAARPLLVTPQLTQPTGIKMSTDLLEPTVEEIKPTSQRLDSNAPLSPELLRKINAYWRAANYLSVGQIYLYDNPLLKEPLKLSHVKPLVVGHWGTTPGQNFIYVHLNRVIKKYDLDMFYVAGARGHGGLGDCREMSTLKAPGPTSIPMSPRTKRG